MKIIVSFKKVWGKELFYPQSDDAKLIAKIIGRPSFVKSQLKLFVQAGWDVKVTQEPFKLDEYLK